MRLLRLSLALGLAAITIAAALVAGVSLRDMRASERMFAGQPAASARTPAVPASTTSAPASPVASATATASPSPIAPTSTPAPPTKAPPSASPRVPAAITPDPSPTARNLAQPCPVPPAAPATGAVPPGVARIVGPPVSANERLSPDGRYISTDIGGVLLHVVGDTATSRSCLLGREARVAGWLPDSSGVVLTASRPAGGRGVYLMKVDGTLRDTGIDAPPVGREAIAFTSDARWIALQQGDVLTIAAMDGTKRIPVETLSYLDGFMSGWIDDRHLLYARATASGKYTYRTADVDGLIAEVPALSASGLPFVAFGSPDGRGALVYSAGASTELAGSFVAFSGTFVKADLQMIFGWSSPSVLVARRARELLLVDITTAATRVVASGIENATFPLFAGPRGPWPFGAGVNGGIVCWHNPGPSLYAADLATGKVGSVSGPSTVLGVTADGHCLTMESLAGGHGLVDARALTR